jgi:hypothetical protein
MSGNFSKVSIRDFPLAWRWTSEEHTLLADDILAQFSAYDQVEAESAFELARALDERSSQVATITTESDYEIVVAWLERNVPITDHVVSVLWSSALGVRVPWKVFVNHWDSFCYPSSDDVDVLSSNEGWLLKYHHFEQFELKKVGSH